MSQITVAITASSGAGSVTAPLVAEHDREFLQMFIEQNPAVMWALDRDLRFVLSEGGGLRLLQKPGEPSVIGLSLYQYLQTDDPDHYIIANHRRALAGESVVFASQVRGREFHNCVRPLRDAAGAITGVIGVALDLTDRAAADRELQQTRNRFETLAQIAPVGIFLLDPTGRMLYCNQRWTQITGLSLDQSRDGGYQQVIHPDDRPRIVQRVNHGFATRTPVRDECRIITPDGRLRYVIGSYDPEFGPEGQLNCFVGTLTDITDLSLAQQALRRSEQHAATARLAARVAHEINNPLAGIKNAFLLIKDAVPSSHPHHAYVGRIEREIDRIAGIVHQMLDLHRPAHEPPHPFHLNQAITDVALFLETKASRGNIAIVTDLPAGDPVLTLPESAIRQILYNLAANAIEASPPGSKILLTAQIITEPCCTLVLKVTDSGVGITPEDRDKIFDPFFSTKRNMANPGLGLGLSVVRSLVMLMNGTIQFTSTPGCGTTFEVQLPEAALPAGAA